MGIPAKVPEQAADAKAAGRSTLIGITSRDGRITGPFAGLQDQPLSVRLKTSKSSLASTNAKL